MGSMGLPLGSRPGPNDRNSNAICAQLRARGRRGDARKARADLPPFVRRAAHRYHRRRGRGNRGWGAKSRGFLVRDRL